MTSSIGRAVAVLAIPVALFAVIGACTRDARPETPAGAVSPAATPAATPTPANPARVAPDTARNTTPPVDTGRAATAGTTAAKAKAKTGPDSARRRDPHRYAFRGTPPSPAFSVKPLPGALLPGKRIVVYYGNPRSKRMGVLGEYPIPVMLGKLDQEARAFQDADPGTPVQPGLHLIVTVAQGSPGRDGMYRLRMSDSLITQWVRLAQSKGYVMFLDVQIGKSTLQAELPRLIPYLSLPFVHLALDPEFSMHYGASGVAPGKKIGTMDASDVNYAISLLDRIAREKHIPPKILVVHRFTQRMLTNYRQIRPLPTVQVVINMDGFGPPWLKRDSYNDYVRMQPVQFTGFKLFYKNDRPMLTRKEVVELTPSPLFITFQ